MKLIIKSLLDCTYRESLEVWNRSWTGYFFDMRLDIKRFLSRFEQENLNPEGCFLAFMGDEPVGFVMNAVENINELRVGWVGGLAVSPEARKMKVGEALINASLSFYQKVRADVSRLEVVKVNDKALKLYQKFGYQPIDDLIHLLYQFESDTAFHLQTIKRGNYRTTSVYPTELAQLPFYNTKASWQTQWMNVKGAEGMIIRDIKGQPLGYALFRIAETRDGSRAVNIYQFVFHPQLNDQRSAAAQLLQEVVNRTKPNERIMLINQSSRNQHLMRFLRQSGFKTHVEQIHMEKPIGMSNINSRD